MLTFFYKRLFSISKLNSKQLLAVAIMFASEKKRLLERYVKAAKNYPFLDAQQWEEFLQQESQLIENLKSHYRKYWGDELDPIVMRQPWRYLHKFLFKRTVLRSKCACDRKYDFGKIIDKISWLEKKTDELYNIAARKTQHIDLRELYYEQCEKSEQRSNRLTRLLCVDKICELNEFSSEDKERKLILTLIQPALAGLMDGSVSTLGPIFAAAFATNSPRETFLVGLSASIGAGISMGFTEAAHDDGKLSGRGSPWKRGIINGAMTAIGGMGHTLPYLINNFQLATTIAIIAVFIELAVIVWIQNKFMKISFSKAAIQVILGGFLVFITGVLIGVS